MEVRYRLRKGQKDGTVELLRTIRASKAWPSDTHDEPFNGSPKEAQARIDSSLEGAVKTLNDPVAQARVKMVEITIVFLSDDQGFYPDQED